MANAFDAMMGVSGNTSIDGPLEIVGDRTMMDPNAPVRSTYREGAYTQQDIIDLGFRENGQIVAPGATLLCQAICTSPFKPMEFLVDSTVAADASITAVDISSSRYIEGGPVPAAVYSEASTSRHVDWRTAQANVPIQVGFRNDSAAPIPVRMSIRGKRLS